MRGRDGLQIVGEGVSSTVIWSAFPDTAEAKKWPMVDMTKSTRCTIRDITIASTPDHMAGCGILQAREVWNSAGFHVMENVAVGGFFTGASLWNAASEVDSYFACLFVNSYVADSPLSGGWSVFIGNGKKATDDPNNCALPYSLVRSPDNIGTYDVPGTGKIFSYGHATMQQTSFYNCQFSSYQGYGYPNMPPIGKHVTIMINCNEGVVTDLHFTGGGFSSSGLDAAKPETCGFAAIYVNGGTVQNMSLTNVRSESGKQKHWFYSPPTAGGITNFRVLGCTLQSLEQTFKLDSIPRSGPILIEDNFIVDQAGYEWGTDRPIYQSVRDKDVTIKGNRLVDIVPTNPKKFNMLYKCTQFSENAYIQTPNAKYVSSPTNGTWGMMIDEYLMPVTSSTGGLRRLYLGGAQSSLGGGTITNHQLFRSIPANDPAKYKEGDVIFVNYSGSYRMYIFGDGKWRFLRFNLN